MSPEEQDYISVTDRETLLRRCAQVCQDCAGPNGAGPQLAAVLPDPRAVWGEGACGPTSQSLILGALFASVSVPPLFSALPQNVTGWKSRAHGALISDQHTVCFDVCFGASQLCGHQLQRLVHVWESCGRSDHCGVGLAGFVWDLFHSRHWCSPPDNTPHWKSCTVQLVAALDPPQQSSQNGNMVSEVPSSRLSSQVSKQAPVHHRDNGQAGSTMTEKLFARI